MAQINLFSCITAWGLISFISYYPLPMWAQSSKLVVQSSLIPQQSVQKTDEFDFRGERRSGGLGGTSAAPCPSKSKTSQGVIALMPFSNWGKTVAERPTFWFYVPFFSEEISGGGNFSWLMKLIT